MFHLATLIKFRQMKHIQLYVFMSVAMGLVSCNFTGEKIWIDEYPSFQSAYIKARQVEVFLPPDYDPSFTYDVLYIHDGQNVFNPHTAFGGEAWELEKALISLQKKQRIRPAIVVAVWNTPLRMQEYMPGKPEDKVLAAARNKGWEGEILSDKYLKFLVEELKPFIDKTYSTNTERESTFIMGSSMGGLISFYALAEYPDVFGGAACISTHWPALDGVFLEYVAENIPLPGRHKLYFDYGTDTIDALYEPYQVKVDSMMAAAGFSEGKDWVSKKFKGAGHSENAWRKRVHIPLEFLLSVDR